MNEATERELQEEREESDPSSVDEGETGDETLEEPREDESPEETMERLREEREEFREKYLRKVADLENLRKRKDQQLREHRKYAHRDLLGDLLEVLDNFERALESMEFENEDVREGCEMIHQQLRELLERYDVEPMRAEGEPFDPHRHEGMMQEEREDLDRSEVLEVFKEGYVYHDRVLRPARVKVGRPAVEEAEEDEGNTNGPEA